MRRTRKPKPLTTAGNAVTVNTTIRAFMASAAFVRGYSDVKRGKPWALDAIELDWHFQYERGRQFAFVFDGPLKDGRTVRREAMAAYKAARTDGTIL